MTHEQADSGNVNPGIETAIRDTVEGDKFYYNCQTCVLAYEMRLRGYDVEAMPFEEKEGYMLGMNLCLAWIDPNTNSNPTMQSIGTHLSGESVFDCLDKAVQNNERFILWHGNKNSSRSHVINMYKDNYGNLVFKDNQRKLSEKSIWKGKSEITSYITTFISKDILFEAYDVKILRVDNLEIDMNIANAITKNKE